MKKARLRNSTNKKRFFGSLISRDKVLLSTTIFIILAVMMVWFFCLPAKLFDKPTSRLLLDRNGEMLGATIAADGQWRFESKAGLPPKFETCILAYEDDGFYDHIGISLTAIVRAALLNAREGEIVSGASTITMQVMRMAREAGSRSFFQKSIEIAWALGAELSYSKKEILGIYAGNAPFGGNVVGLEAAAWRYFQKPPEALTWAESAALAVLPNAPGLIFPGRNPEAFERKRNALLSKLHDAQIIDQDTYRLSLLEPLPGLPLPLPATAYHLLATRDHFIYSGRPSTLDAAIQSRATDIIARRLDVLKRNHIYNGAILIADTETGEVLAYVANGAPSGERNGSANDMVMTPRSSGSILKPFLFGAMIEKGMITPATLIPDIPTQYSGFAPRNFDEGYSGAVHAEEALARSLNIPAVRMLRDFGIPNFQARLKHWGFSTLVYPPSHYGLSLILGGAEVTLWDLRKCLSIFGCSGTRFWPERSSGYFPLFERAGRVKTYWDRPSHGLGYGRSYGFAYPPRRASQLGSVWRKPEDSLENRHELWL